MLWDGTVLVLAAVRETLQQSHSCIKGITSLKNKSWQGDSEAESDGSSSRNYISGTTD